MSPGRHDWSTKAKLIFLWCDWPSKKFTHLNEVRTTALYSSTSILSGTSEFVCLV